MFNKLVVMKIYNEISKRSFIHEQFAVNWILKHSVIIARSYFIKLPLYVLYVSVLVCKKISDNGDKPISSEH